MEKLLIIEDNEYIREQMRLGFSKDYQVIEAADRQKALALFRAHAPKVIALDLGLPPDENGFQEGFNCLEEILRIDPATRIIMITGNADRQIALRSVQSGAFDYYCKPVNIAELKVIVSRAFYLAAIERENNRFTSDATNNHAGPGGIIGQSTRMQEVFSSINKVSQSDVAVLITGESGTGKELVARAIHSSSRRKTGSYIALNCGAIPENLIEAELFGYEKGPSAALIHEYRGRWNLLTAAPCFWMKSEIFP
jgi:Response regulator containing CheY-like receiver, AAA-type ATPase, and DNA-binding domains